LTTPFAAWPHLVARVAFVPKVPRALQPDQWRPHLCLRAGC